MFSVRNNFDYISNGKHKLSEKQNENESLPLMHPGLALRNYGKPNYEYLRNDFQNSAFCLREVLEYLRTC